MKNHNILIYVVTTLPGLLWGDELKGTVYLPNSSNPAKESTYWVENSMGEIIIPRETTEDGHFSLVIANGSEITVHAKSWSCLPGSTSVTVTKNPTTANVRLLPLITGSSYGEWIEFGEYNARQYARWAAGGFSEEEKDDAASLLTPQHLRNSNIPSKFIFGYLSGAKSSGGSSGKALDKMEILTEGKQSDVIEALVFIEASYKKDSTLPTYFQVQKDAQIPISENEYAEILGFLAPAKETLQWKEALEKAQLDSSGKEKVVKTSQTVTKLFQFTDES
ncbi:MAG: hypothetical protein P1V20_28675 [Verrucomicrobiales bacterium]|nr:hypothetical protein [Verrucomicrobiales bacterium]